MLLISWFKRPALKAHHGSSHHSHHPHHLAAQQSTWKELVHKFLRSLQLQPKDWDPTNGKHPSLPPRSWFKEALKREITNKKIQKQCQFMSQQVSKKKYSTALRIMGSQNWWFGDPRPLLYTAKPLYSRVQWCLGTEGFGWHSWLFCWLRSTTCSTFCFGTSRDSQPTTDDFHRKKNIICRWKQPWIRQYVSKKQIFKLYQLQKLP